MVVELCNTLGISNEKWENVETQCIECVVVISVALMTGCGA